MFEVGRNSPSVRMMFRLCDALDITPSDMLKDVERRMRVQGKRMVSNLQNASIIKGHSILDRTHASHQHMRTFTVPLNLNRIDKNGK